MATIEETCRYYGVESDQIEDIVAVYNIPVTRDFEGDIEDVDLGAPEAIAALFQMHEQEVGYAPDAMV